MIPKRFRKKAVKLFVMNAKVLKKRKKRLNFSPLKRGKVVRLAVIVMVLATCGFGGYEAGHYLLLDARFAVKHIVVVGNERLSNEEIVRMSSLAEGENIFRARIHEARKRLSKVAIIQDVSVTRLVPDTIVIGVAERHPRARLWGMRTLLADYSGVVLPGSSCADPEKLPLIKGVDTAYLSVGDKCSRPEMVKAMRVLELCKSPRLSGLVEAEMIDSSSAEDAVLYLKEGSYTREGCEVRLGGDDFEQKLANLAELLRPVVEKHGKKIRYVEQWARQSTCRF